VGLKFFHIRFRLGLLIGFLPVIGPLASDASDGHWAYERPVRPELPRLAKRESQGSPVDHFIQDRLAKAGLEYSRLAKPERQLRRLYLDFVGRPPQPGEGLQFLANPTSREYERLVDRLLASPQYGEKWARRWLDLARYADSNGFQADQLRDSWAYRDWVIEAFNSGMPFDQFAIEQLAGDLLPGATLTQKIATGFHRTPTCNVEAGVHPESNRVNQVIDRVNTTGTVFLGTTLECAQCHDHKYDPISMKEYYELFAFFNNTPLEVKNTSGVTWDFYGPKLDLPLSRAKAAKRAKLADEMKAREDEKKSIQRSLAVEQKDWEAIVIEKLKTAPQWTALEIEKFEATGGASHTIKDDRSVLVHGRNPDKSTYTIRVKPDGVQQISAIRLETLLDDSMKKRGAGRNFDVPENPNFVLNEFSLKVNGEKIAFSGATASFSQAKYDVAGAIDSNAKTAWAVNPQFGRPHEAVFLLKNELLVKEVSLLEFQLVQHHGGGRTIGRLRLSVVDGDPAKLSLPSDVQTILLAEKRTNEQSKRLAVYYASQHPRLKELDQRLAKLKSERDAIRPDSTLVMNEMGGARETRVMLRGDYLNTGEAVSSGTPAVLHSFDDRLPGNRLGLAKWLVAPENPLMSRVAVNRWWASFMGQGIVSTQEDFGTQGEAPTHPGLLDWLAVELVESGWSMKHIHKLIVMSHAYRQSSVVSNKHLQKDPANKLYARAPRVRMSAEMIRDSALATSGLLEGRMFGPPIYPPQPDGIWRHVGRNAPKFVPATNENRFRRGVYVVWRRGAPYASFVNFDAPDRGACVVDRPRTNTPLQALTLLNDHAYVEMALAFANRIVSEPGLATDEQRIRFAFRVALSREAKPVEVGYLKSLLAKRGAELANAPKTAEALVGEARGMAFPKDATKRLAKWFAVANILLNLDEAIVKG